MGEVVNTKKSPGVFGPGWLAAALALVGGEKVRQECQEG
jgi:hypothetical protein